jgi:amino acid transporter
MSRVISAILGTLALFAGIVALVGYAYPSLQDLLPPPSGTIFYNHASFGERLFGLVINWSLTLGAFYMGFRFLRRAIGSRKDFKL